MISLFRWRRRGRFISENGVVDRVWLTLRPLAQTEPGKNDQEVSEVIQRHDLRQVQEAERRGHLNAKRSGSTGRRRFIAELRSRCVFFKDTRSFKASRVGVGHDQLVINHHDDGIVRVLGTAPAQQQACDDKSEEELLRDGAIPHGLHF